MIRDLDASLKAMLSGEAKRGSELASAAVSFATPDKEWRMQGSGLELNVYLYRAIENRQLRSNARRPQINTDGTIAQQLFPVRVECSYVISAWSKAAELAGVAKEEEEHRLLSQVLYVMWRNPTLPSRYLVGLLADAEIPPPIMTAESEDIVAKPDFWTSLETPVRPSITCRITIAMDLDLETVWPQATTLATSVASGEPRFTIGGIVRNAAVPASAIPDAWIRLDGSSQTYVSNGQGRFVIDRIAPGPHSLTVRAVGFREASHAFDVPDPSGRYDVVLTPI